jgi:hypothetical protein
LKDYLHLPPSEYSTNILLVDAVERVDEKTFKCSLASVSFLGKTVYPVITCVVRVEDSDAFFNVVSAEIKSNDEAIQRLCNNNVQV